MISEGTEVNPLSSSVAHLICCEKKLTALFMWATLVLNGLTNLLKFT